MSGNAALIGAAIMSAYMALASGWQVVEKLHPAAAYQDGAKK
jgi:hypothetical protein